MEIRKVDNVNRLDKMNQISKLTVNDLDDYSLDYIFRFLNFIDIRICSNVCLRWYILALRFDKDCLVINFGTCSYEKNHFVKLKQRLESIGNQSIDQNSSCLKQTVRKKVSKIQPQPVIIENNNLFKASNRQFFKTIKTFIFNGNSRFNVQDKGFSLEIFSNLEYLQINDYHFSSLITRTESREVSTSLKYLAVEVFEPSSIYRFPNLIYLRANHLNYTWDFKRSKLKYVDIKDVFTDYLFDFIIISCSEVECLDLKSSLIDECGRNLAELLYHLKHLRELNLNLDFSYNQQLVRFLSEKLSWNKNLKKLTINNLHIKTDCKEEIKISDLYPIYNWDSILDLYNLDYITNDKRPNFDKLKYYENVETLKITSNDDIPLFQKHSKLIKNLKGLVIKEFYDSHDGQKFFKINIKPLMESIPKTVKNFRLFLSYKIDQNLLNNLPRQLPSLERFEFIDHLNIVYDLGFISEFTYLSTIDFHFVNIKDIYQLVDALEKCKFLSKIHLITSSPKKGYYYKDGLLKYIRLKERSMDHMIFDFLINGTKIGVLI